jgi:hypothetical protein
MLRSKIGELWRRYMQGREIVGMDEAMNKYYLCEGPACLCAQQILVPNSAGSWPAEEHAPRCFEPQVYSQSISSQGCHLRTCRWQQKDYKGDFTERREVQLYKPPAQMADYDPTAIPTEWRSWLNGHRRVPPSPEESERCAQRQQLEAPPRCIRAGSPADQTATLRRG